VGGSVDHHHLIAAANQSSSRIFLISATKPVLHRVSGDSSVECIASARRVQVPIDGIGGAVDNLAPMMEIETNSIW